LCDTERAMGLAYGATDASSSGGAKRVGVVIGPDGKVKHYFPKVDARAFPEEALNLV
jgi:peroxiredoxin Q/BCP